MPARTIVCPDCGETVPSGRLTCPACGAMLASIAGAVRPAVSHEAAPADRAPTDDVPDDDPAALAPGRIQTTALPEASAEDAPARTYPAARGPATPMAPSSIRQTQVELPGSAADEQAMTTPTAAAVDGAHLPPGTPMAPAALPGPSSPAPGVSALPATPASPDATPDGSTPAPTTVDLARVDQAIGYAGAAGSGLIAFGMLMPWSRAVIGASGVDGLFNTWGLASPGFVLVLLSALAVLAISVVPNPIPASVRAGLVGLMLGVFSLGLVWPYVIGPLGAGIGVIVVTVGAIVLTASGIVSVWRHRHADGDASV